MDREPVECSACMTTVSSAPRMASPQGLPVWILCQLSRLAIETDDPESLEKPFIRWYSEDIMFARSKKL
ncbi:hypothetical protein FA13DRAFT_1736639, partial [Coprinellus micaceus]